MSRKYFQEFHFSGRDAANTPAAAKNNKNTMDANRCRGAPVIAIFLLPNGGYKGRKPPARATPARGRKRSCRRGRAWPGQRRKLSQPPVRRATKLASATVGIFAARRAGSVPSRRLPREST